MIIVNSDYAGDNNDGVIQQRIGTTAEWENIIPYNGEVIIEITDEKDDAGNNIRLARIGDGEKPVSQLPILGLEGGGVGKKTLDGGEIFNTYADIEGTFYYKNEALGGGSHAEGISTTAGMKRLKVININTDSGTITIPSKDIEKLQEVIKNKLYKSQIEKVYLFDFSNDVFYNTPIELDLLTLKKTTINNSDSYTLTINNFTEGLIKEEVIDALKESFNYIYLAITSLNGLFVIAETLTEHGSHAEGTFSKAIGENSHAEGGDTKAFGKYSHAEGDTTKAGAQASHAEGANTQANGWASHAGGYNTIADGSSQTVIGRYNDPNTEDLFIIGNGKSANERSNILSVNKDSVQVHKDLNVEQNITAPNLNVTDNINANNLKVNTVTSNSENNNINIKSKIIAEQGISANEESEFNNITVNEKIEVKDLEITGEFILSGESAGDLITSDNFKGEIKLSEILNLNNKDNKIGDTYIISDIDEQDFITNIELFKDRIIFNANLDPDTARYNGYAETGFDSSDIDSLENSTIYIYVKDLIANTSLKIPTGNDYYGVILNLSDLEREENFIIKNDDSNYAKYYIYSTGEGIIEINKNSFSNATLTYEDFLKQLFIIKKKFSKTKINEFNVLNDNTYQLLGTIAKDRALQIEAMDNPQISFKYFTSFKQLSNNEAQETDIILNEISDDAPYFSFSESTNSELKNIEIIIPQAKYLEMQAAYQNKGSNLYQYYPELIEIDYENWENKEDSFVVWQKSSFKSICPTEGCEDIPTITVVETKITQENMRSGLKKGDYATWLAKNPEDENSCSWHFISSPYDNIFISDEDPTSLILNSNSNKIDNKIIGPDEESPQVSKNNILAGFNNTLSTVNNSFAIGNRNTADYTFNTLITGESNSISSNSNSIIAGNNNIINNAQDSIINGNDNSVSSIDNSIINGYNNTNGASFLSNIFMSGSGLEITNTGNAFMNDATLLGRYNDNTFYNNNDFHQNYGSQIFAIGSGSGTKGDNNERRNALMITTKADEDYIIIPKNTKMIFQGGNNNNNVFLMGLDDNNQMNFNGTIFNPEIFKYKMIASAGYSRSVSLPCYEYFAFNENDLPEGKDVKEDSIYLGSSPQTIKNVKWFKSHSYADSKEFYIWPITKKPFSINPFIKNNFHLLFEDYARNYFDDDYPAFDRIFIYIHNSNIKSFNPITDENFNINNEHIPSIILKRRPVNGGYEDCTFRTSYLKCIEDNGGFIYLDEDGLSLGEDQAISVYGAVQTSNDDIVKSEDNNQTGFYKKGLDSKYIYLRTSELHGEIVLDIPDESTFVK